MNIAKIWKLVVVVALSFLAGIGFGSALSRNQVEPSPGEITTPDSSLTTPLRDCPTQDKVADAPPSEFPNLAERFLESEFLDLPTLLARRQLIEKWIGIDAVAAYRKMAEDRGHEIESEFVAIWARLAPEQLLRFANREQNTTLMNYALLDLAKSRPELVIGTITENPDFEFWDQLLGEVVSKIAKESPDRAESLIEKFEDYQSFKSAFRTNQNHPGWNPRFILARAKALHDLGDAMNYAGRTEDPDEKRMLFAFMFSEVALEGIGTENFYRSAISQTGGFATQVAESIAEVDPLRAVEWLAENADTGEHREALLEIANSFRTPEDVEKAYNLIENESLGENFVEMHLGNWNNRDVKAGIDFIKKYARDEKRNKWFRDLASGVGRANFQRAYELADQVGNTSCRDDFRRALLVDYAVSFPEKALALAELSGEQELYWDVYRNILEYDYGPWQRRPEESAKLLLKLPESHTAGTFSTTLARFWWEWDQAGAVAWTESVEHRGNRLNAIRGLLDEMAKDSPDEAIAFAESRTDPVDRRVSVESVVGDLADRNPERLFRLATSLDPGTQRTNMLNRVAGAWARQSPNSAISAIEQSASLSPREKERLSTRIYPD